MRFLTRKRLGKEAAWNEAMNACQSYYASIQSKLPESAINFDKALRRNPLHDLSILSAESSKGSLTLEFDWYRLCFSGVLRLRLEDKTPLVDDYWLYEEFDLASGDRFTLNVLLGDNELSLGARDVTFFNKINKQWLVAPK